MLYVAPERLRSLEFVLSLPRGRRPVRRGEAHCISEWGHDFRPDYLFLPRAVRDLGSPPVLALTATATRASARTLRSLKMRSPEVVVTSFNRPNLTYRVLSAKEKKHKLPLILDVIRNAAPPGIVYATTRNAWRSWPPTCAAPVWTPPPTTRVWGLRNDRTFRSAS